jgi:hypothetical protein
MKRSFFAVLIFSMALSGAARAQSYIINPAGLGGFEQVNAENFSTTGTPYTTGATGITGTTGQTSYNTYKGSISDLNSGGSANWFDGGVGGPSASGTLGLVAINSPYSGSARGIVGWNTPATNNVQLPTLDTGYSISEGDAYQLSLAYALGSGGTTGDAFQIVLAYGAPGLTSTSSLVTLSSETFAPNTPFGTSWLYTTTPITFAPVTNSGAAGEDLYLYFTVGTVAAGNVGGYGTFGYTGTALKNNHFMSVDDISLTTVSVPEPSVYALLLASVLGCRVWCFRRRVRATPGGPDGSGAPADSHAPFTKSRSI